MKRHGGTCDVLVIGSGSAGFSAAETAARMGAKVCLVEQAAWGGECPNWACVPTKALLRSAHMYQTVQDARAFGVRTDGASFHYEEIINRKAEIVRLMTGNGRKVPVLSEREGIATVRGKATFLNAHTVSVDGTEIRAKAVVLANGTAPFIPPIAGIKEIDYWTFRDAVSAKHLPKSLAIIGAGPVGCEFATFFSTFGVKVTMFQTNPQVLPREDRDIAGLAREALEERGVIIHTETRVLSVASEKKGVRLTYQSRQNPRKTMHVERVLIATGNRPNFDGLGIEAADIRLDDRGKLQLNDTLQTSVKQVFAAGDITGGMRFTHTAAYEGAIAGYNAANFAKRRTKRMKRDLRVVPRATFVDPEVASVGITTEEAHDRDIPVLEGRVPVGALGRAAIDGASFGLMKLVVRKDTYEVLGGHYIGPRAGEVIHEVALAMHARLTAHDLAGMIHAYPTYSEIVSMAAGSVK